MSSFALSTVPPFLDGVYLGINAVPDAWLLIDCPSGCFCKCERIALNHDLTSTLFDPMGEHRIVQSGVTFSDFAMGNEPLLARLMDQLTARGLPGAVFVAQASSVALASQDMSALTERLSRRADVPVIPIASETFEGDWIDGFERFGEAVVAALSAIRGGDHKGTGAPGKNKVSIVGYLADRLEADHRANIDELRRLLEALGLELQTVLAGGAPLGDLGRLFDSSLLLAFPYAGSTARRVAAESGAEVLEVELPVGVGGTARFIEAVAGATGRERQADLLMRREIPLCVPAIERAADRFLQDTKIAIAADPALAAGLIRFAADLGTEVSVVAARTRSAARTIGLESAPEATKKRTLLYDATPSDLAAAITGMETGERPQVLVATTMELDVACDLAMGFVELGYPSYMVHALAPRPSLGFAGALELCQELVRARQSAEYEQSRRAAATPRETLP